MLNEEREHGMLSCDSYGFELTIKTHINIILFSYVRIYSIINNIILVFFVFLNFQLDDTYQVSNASISAFLENNVPKVFHEIGYMFMDNCMTKFGK